MSWAAAAQRAAAAHRSPGRERAEAACVNRGGNFPEAENKESFSTSGDFPVQNGRASFSLSLTATFQPKCSPPMMVVWGGGTITVSGSSFETFSYSF